MLVSTSQDEASRGQAAGGPARVTEPAGWIACNCLLLQVCIGMAVVGLTKASEVARVTSSSQRVGVVFLWFVGIAVALMLWRADSLPQSHSIAISGSIAGFGIGGVSFAQLWTAGVSLAACVVLFAALGVAFQVPLGARASIAEPVHPHVNAMKERAAIKGDQLLAALPNVSGSHTYLLVDRTGGRARIVDAAEDDPEVTAMPLTLQARFGNLAFQGDRPASIEVRLCSAIRR